MAKKPNKKKMGRPLIAIPQDDFENLCKLLCTLEDIAGFFNCSPDTIERWCQRTYGETFADVHKRKSSVGKVSLRRKQMEIGLLGNVTMLIWLGKQNLGQKDREREPDRGIDEPPPPTINNTTIIYETQWGSSIEPGKKPEDEST